MRQQLRSPGAFAMRANDRRFWEALRRPSGVGRQSSINDRYGAQFATTAVVDCGRLERRNRCALTRAVIIRGGRSRLRPQRGEQPRCAVHLRISPASGAVRYVPPKEYANQE